MGVQGSRADAQSDDNAQINAIYQQFGTALRHKDVNAIMSLYVRGNTLFVFDVSTPREHVGWQSYYDDWKGFFASVKGGLTFNISELNVTVSGDVAYTRSFNPLPEIWAVFALSTFELPTSCVKSTASG